MSAKITSPETIFTHSLPTPLGMVALAAGPQGLRAISLGQNLRQATNTWRQTWPDARFENTPSFFYKLEVQLKRYFAGKKVAWKVALDWDQVASEFTRRTLKSAEKIPYGKTVSYQELAQLAAHPQACRAVGTALGKNPWPIVIPCHRVIADSGKIGGFSSGLNWKRALLKLEGGERFDSRPNRVMLQSAKPR